MSDNSDFAEFHDDLEKAERKVAGQFDPGARGVVVAVGVLAAIASLILMHAGKANGFDVLTYSSAAQAERIAITSRIFVYFLVIFGVGFSALALLTRRWAIAWIALCGNLIAVVAGLLSWWTRNTPGVTGETPPSGVGIGLIVGWIAAMVLSFHWARLVWARSSYQLALEAERRAEAAEREEAVRELQRRHNQK
ncbi:hypothetical protein GOEFS_042_00520 [Gordonia effusa NBRC 100432]|uniref:Transmembrane protein n=1 Tax=Gordonia effusa NBRC 100432 TaxID=1077974 RepID=H0QYR0_9ACTN|nr:hypothetical protein [Gordonia effusa]GAB17961.1 hypothetical protein GOEFS_042_00520 [Gordonia effusa NBRC 100432]